MPRHSSVVGQSNRGKDPKNSKLTYSFVGIVKASQTVDARYARLLNLCCCGESPQALGSFSTTAASSYCSVDTFDSMTYLIAIWILAVVVHQVKMQGGTLIFKFRSPDFIYLDEKLGRPGLSSPHPQVSRDHLTWKGVSDQLFRIDVAIDIVP